MKIGKLDNHLLEEIVFKNITYKRPEVMTRPGIGEDCAVVDFGPYDCVMSTDPITGAVHKIGRLAVHISCNDIASNGVEPLGLLLACLLPESITPEEIDEIMRQAGEEAEKLGVEIIGGHTEITPAVNQPIIVSTALGRTLKKTLTAEEKIQPGDAILMTKQAGLEGTAILAWDQEEKLNDRLTPRELLEAKAMLDEVSVVKEGVLAGKIGISGMHDITEGGVLGAVYEMCQIGKTGAEIWFEKIPVAGVTKKICDCYGLDWLRLISSGSMMIITRPDKRALMMKELLGAGIPVAEIGIVTDVSQGCVLIEKEVTSEIKPPGSDELYRAVYDK